MSIKTSLGSFLVFLLSCTSVSLAVVQSGPLMQVRYNMPDGTSVAFLTYSDSESSGSIEFDSPHGGGFKKTERAIHRFFVDHQNNLYFGYDLVVERLGESSQYRVSINPLSLTPTELGLGGNYASAATTIYPSPQIIEDKDEIQFDVLFNPKTQQKITEKIIIVSSESSTLITASNKSPYSSDPDDRKLRASNSYVSTITSSEESPANSGPPRDFMLDDVRLRADNPVLSINGKAVLRTEGYIAGSMLWLYVPSKGRYLLSIAAREGYRFEKAGVVQGNRLSIVLDGETIELKSDVPIFDIAGAWNLYVLRQPSYRMDEGAERDFAVGSTNRIN